MSSPRHSYSAFGVSRTIRDNGSLLLPFMILPMLYCCGSTRTIGVSRWGATQSRIAQPQCAEHHASRAAVLIEEWERSREPATSLCRSSFGRDGSFAPGFTSKRPSSGSHVSTGHTSINADVVYRAREVTRRRWHGPGRGRDLTGGPDMDSQSCLPTEWQISLAGKRRDGDVL